MLSHLWGVRLAVLIAAAASLGACRAFSPDGGMEMVAAVAGTGLNKDVVQIRSAEDAAAVRVRVTKLLHRPLGADAAVQIALLNNLGLQAAYKRLGIAEALAVKASRPPSLSFAFSDVSTPVELDIERQIIGSLLTLVTMPARTRIASDQFTAAELRAAEETLRVAAETRRAYLRAVAAREIVAALGEAKANAEASAELAGQLSQLGVNAASETREAYGAYRATYDVARKYEAEVLPLHQTISAETELQYNAMQIDAFALLQAAREQLRAKVAGIEAKRNFWLASTDLSVAMLGGGAIASEPDAVIAATSSSTNAE
jgi:outer membrane protein TolC